jgi:hypothetical protein
VGEAVFIKADLHVHTCFSGDSNTSPEALVERCRALDLCCIAVCDHGTTDGARAVEAIAPFKVIVSEEIMTTRGEIIGMFLQQTIPSGLGVAETIQRIRQQHGLVCIPHPFDPYRSSGMQSDALSGIISDIDIVEVFNARTIPIQNMSRPRDFASKHHLRMGAGSDAHTPAEVGRAYVTIPDFNGREEFLEAMRHSKVHGNSANPLRVVAGLPARLQRKLFTKH